MTFKRTPENLARFVEAVRNSLKVQEDDLDEKFPWVKCWGCGKYFRELSWNDPPSCPFCRKSRVD
jgi:predicted Zn-ribbon and HTH transcriptional regulator